MPAQMRGPHRGTLVLLLVPVGVSFTPMLLFGSGPSVILPVTQMFCPAALAHARDAGWRRRGVHPHSMTIIGSVLSSPRRDAVMQRIVPLCLALALSTVLAHGPLAAPERAIAITVDDLPVAPGMRDPANDARVTRDLVASLRRAGAPAIGFVNEGKLYVNGAPDPRRVALLRQWIDAGLHLGNHTFSHLDLNATPLEEVQRDVLKGELVTRGLMSAAGRRLRYFRHPFLRTGRSLEVRNRFERFLRERGYVVAPVTYDNYDYVFAAAYDRTTQDAAGARATIASTYVDYMERIAAYYERQSVAIVGREFPQVLLLHANALNADTFDRLAARLRVRGYRFVSLDEALADPAYRTADEYAGPAGITWIHRWALTKGVRRDVFAGEPTVPGWITAAARGERSK